MHNSLIPHCLVQISLFNIYYKVNFMWIFLVCLVSLPLFFVNTSDLLSYIIRCACYGATCVSLFRSSFIIILKFSISTPEVRSALYSLSALDWSIGPGTFFNDQLFQLDKTQYILLYSFHYMYNPSRWNKGTSSIGSQY